MLYSSLHYALKRYNPSLKTFELTLVNTLQILITLIAEIPRMNGMMMNVSNLIYRCKPSSPIIHFPRMHLLDNSDKPSLKNISIMELYKVWLFKSYYNHLTAVLC